MKKKINFHYTHAPPHRMYRSVSVRFSTSKFQLSNSTYVTIAWMCAAAIYLWWFLIQEAFALVVFLSPSLDTRTEKKIRIKTMWDNTKIYRWHLFTWHKLSMSNENLSIYRNTFASTQQAQLQQQKRQRWKKSLEIATRIPFHKFFFRSLLKLMYLFYAIRAMAIGSHDKANQTFRWCQTAKHGRERERERTKCVVCYRLLTFGPMVGCCCCCRCAWCMSGALW